MKVLVTGTSGLLGSELLKAIADRAFSGSGLNRSAFMNANASTRASLLSGYDVIIHAAANTNVEQCELDPEACYRDNCFLTEILFRHARKLDVKFVLISSTGVYGRGKSVPYQEYDQVSPTTVHHHSKHIAEKAVLADSSSLVVRTGWLFGGRMDNPKNFVANRLNEARKTVQTLHANSTQTGSPTYARDCAQRLLDLIEDDCSGIYNIVNDQAATRFDYVRQIIELSAAPLEVQPVTASGFKRHADVSENESAVSLRMLFEGRTPLRPWQDALAEYMRDHGLLGCLGTGVKPGSNN